VARQRKYVFECDLTQQEIAQRLGTHQPQIRRWLNGHDFPRYRTLCRLAAVMGMRPAVLAQHIESESARRQGAQRYGVKNIPTHVSKYGVMVII
jgi:transcriptional regulator with XRE-family HTH domain